MIRTRVLTLTVALLLSACSGNEPSPAGPGDPGPTTYMVRVTSGTGQEVRVGEPVGPITIRVTDNTGAGVGNTALGVGVVSGGGSAVSTVTTRPDGSATISGWTVGAAPGPNVLRVSSASLGVSVDVSAVARYPRWTVMVYMAADNSLARAGLLDLEEIESVAVDPDVQVTVQAEFSPTEFSFLGCGTNCLNRPNFNTVRYLVAGGSPPVLGFDGPVQDIGNVDMTQPSELQSFIAWAQSTAPAERYLLVPWNHGGGYEALIEDATSAGNELMRMDEFRTALAGIDRLDIIDFDMCSMAGYETLLALEGEADYAVFSEEVVPGDGLPYDVVLPRLSQISDSPTEQVASMLVDAYHTSYIGSRTATTKSAYRVDGVRALDDALDGLSAALLPQLGARKVQLQSVLQASQKYQIPEQTDIVSFAQLLSVSGVDPALDAALGQVVSAAQSPSFRIANRIRNGDPYQNDVSRSTGLHLVFPSGIGSDRFSASGRGSAGFYSSSHPSSGWADLLLAWDATVAPSSTVDLGPSNRLELYLLWDQLSASSGADVDMLLLEPDGSVYLPWIGVITPNGRLTMDSEQSGANYEGFGSNRYVDSGTYSWYAWLWSDPANSQPTLEVLYRFQPSQPFVPLYDGANPWLSMQTRFEDDPTATFAEANAGAYTNFRLVSTWNPAGGAAAPSASAPQAVEGQTGAVVTEAQMVTIRRLMDQRRRGGR